MVYLCVDQDGQEMIFDKKPYRTEGGDGLGFWSRSKYQDFCNVDIPKGTIKKLIGRDMTWEEEPYEFNGPINIQANKKKINWKILLLSFIWSSVAVLLLLSGIFHKKFIGFIIITLILTFVFYFGYRDIDLTNDYTEDEKDFFKKGQ